MTDRLRLHLLRHADAGDSVAWSGPDATRPLTSKGRGQAERLGRFLAASGVAIDALVTSPKVRAGETADLIAVALGLTVRVDDRLGDPLSFEALTAVLADAGSPIAPILVGHDPDLSELASSLTGAAMAMKKGAIVAIDVQGALGPGAGSLRWLVPPAILVAGDRQA